MMKPAVPPPEQSPDLLQAIRRISELEAELEAQRQNPDQTPYQLCRQDLSKLNALIDSSADLIWLLDCDKKLVQANGTALAALQAFNAAEVSPGQSVPAMFPDHEAERFSNIFERVLQGQTEQTEFKTPGGRIFSATIQPVRDGQQITGASTFARDVTQTRHLEEELRRYGQVIASTPTLIAVLDRDARFHLANDAYLRAFNRNRSELIGTHISGLISATHYQQHTEPNLRKAFAGEPCQFQSWMDLPTLGHRFMTITYHPLQDPPQAPEFVVVSVHDITDLKQAEDNRRRIFEVSLDMLCISDFDGRFRELNPAWTKNLGWSEEELQGRSWLDFIDPDDFATSLAAGEKLARGESLVGFENRYRCKDGSLKWLAWSSYPDSEQQKIYSAVRDITTRKKMEEKLQRLAATDPLTGAGNRRHFIQCAEQELKRSSRYGSQLAVVMLDIDYFKKINDRYGHATGDEVLKKLVDCCLQELRATDIFGRFGGEEFAAVLIETDRTTALETCNRLLQQISKLKINTADQTLNVTVSIGLTMRSAEDISIDPLLKRADDALYQAKEAGRNRVVLL